MRRILLVVALLSLTACAHAAQEKKSAPAPATEPTVDDRCTTDADCEVKNVGNCCGYYPACVNRESPTFPDRVKAECTKKGMMGVCGFPELAGCSCVEGRCADVPKGDAVR
jgi:hypothetical protein